jgi:uncharacterized protein YcbK (DUF882 family)
VLTLDLSRSSPGCSPQCFRRAFRKPETGFPKDAAGALASALSYPGFSCHEAPGTALEGEKTKVKMATRFHVHVLVGAVCALALPSPVLFATPIKGAALLQHMIPGLPLSIAATTPKSPGEGTSAPSGAEARHAPAETTFQPVEIQALPSREVQVLVQNVHTRESARFSIGVHGRTRLEEAAAIEQFFRCRRSGRHKPLADGVLALLVDIAQRWPGRVIEVVSGYRAPPFGVRHSKHFAGHAIDLRVRGVRTSRVRDFVWRGHQEVGVGHYAVQDFVHIDSRPGDADTAWSAPHEDSRPQYAPRWAKRARRPLPRSIPGAMAAL